MKKELKGMCKNAKAAFASQSVYESIKKMTKKANVEVACDRQTFRNNTNARTQVAYFRRTIFLLFLDNLLEQYPL